MSFLEPSYFWLLVVFVIVFIQRDRWSYSTATLALVVSFLCIVVSLARPVIEQEPIKQEQILSDVVVAIDLSYSMQAQDLKPNRLQQAKESLHKLVNTEQKNRYGVIGFTTNAIILSPLTQDSELLEHLVDSLNSSLITTKGSSILPALELARKLSKAKKLRVVFLSDGGDNTLYEEEIAFAKANNIVVNIMMLATPVGSTLQLPDGSLLYDQNEDLVVSRENRTIESLSNATGGIYTKDLADLRDALQSQRQEDYKTSNILYQNRELFYYPLALALLFFVIATTHLHKKVFKPFIWVFVVMGISLDAGVLDPIYLNTAQKKYKEGAYEQAAKLYEQVRTSKAFFNAGCSYYKAGMYEKALELFAQVHSDEREFKAQLFYNRANTFVRLKEFAKAREEYLKSLTLHYTSQADENLAYIKDVAEQKSMTKEKQKSQKKSLAAKEEKSSMKKKEGGGSNMQVSTDASSKGASSAKKTKAEEIFSQNSSKTKLSSLQYELINKRGVNEKKPW